MTDFKNGQELLEVCKKKQCSISEVMKQREIEGTSSTKKEVEDKMRKALAIMKEAVRKPLEDPKPSMSGLIGGEAKQITGYRESGTNVCGTFMNKLIAYSMAVLEVNASMGVIVAAPTAGSSGVVPGVLLALQEEKGFSDEQMTDALFHTAAIGYLLMRNASVAGAEAGCQAEVGAASAMAAAAVTELMGGTPEMCLQAAYTGNLEEAEEFKKEIQEVFPGQEIHMDPLSLSVACHIGHGALAVACSRKVTL